MFRKVKLILILLLAYTFPMHTSHSIDSGSIQNIKIDTLGMEVSPIEIDLIKEAMQLGPKISEAAEKVNGRPYRRDAHAKATGCLRADFIVNGDIPSYLQHSIFSSPGREYKAWIRFSNGDMAVQPDSKGDARGMAIKVMNVEGEKIAPELQGPATQDFVMTNNPVFFHRNVFDYVEDMKYLAKLQRTRWFINIFPPRLHPKRLKIALDTVSTKINTPLQAQYFSMVPYQLADVELKFSAKPCPGMEFDVKVNTSEYDYLTEAMKSQLDTESACFDFMVQEKKAGKNMPIDDATVVWSEEDSPFIPIARVNIPSQTFTSKSQQEFCENLSMNPWHGVGNWTPLGSLNRARRLVYNAVSQFRHAKNNAQQFQPTSWCLNGEEQCDVSQFVHLNTKVPQLSKCFDSRSNAWTQNDKSCGDW